MKKLVKLPVLILAGAMLMSTTSYAQELRNSFSGANGGTRIITGMVTDGNITTFTVETTNRRGITKTKEFTATRNGDSFDISGNGQQLFKDFLSAHAREAQGLNNVVINESQDLNRMAYDAWLEHQVQRWQDAGLPIFAEQVANTPYSISFDFIGRADELGIEWRPVAPTEDDSLDFSDFVSAPDAITEPAMTNEEAYIAFNELRGNTVYTPYQYVSSVDWVEMYNNDVAAREEFNNSGVDSHQALDAETQARIAQSNAEHDAQVADHNERHHRLSSRNQRLTELDEETRLANLYVIGQEDDMTGRERIEEFFDMINNQNVEYIERHNRYITDSVERGYEHVNVRGLEAVHQTGWTGQGVEIFVNDNPTHGRTVAEAARFVAPGATILGDKENDFSWQNHFQIGADVVNLSVGYQTHSPRYGYHGAAEDPRALANYGAEGYNGVVDRHPGALFITSLPNTTSCEGIDFAVCDAQVAAINHGLLNGDWILVGAKGPRYNSAAIGDSEAKYHTVYTSGRSVSGRVYGTSFATPKVTGAAALIMQKYPNLKAGEVKDIILESAFRDFEGYSLERYGRGILDVSAALSPIGGIN